MHACVGVDNLDSSLKLVDDRLSDADDAIIFPARFSSSQLKPRPSCRAIKMLADGGTLSALIYIKRESIFFLGARYDKYETFSGIDRDRNIPR